MWSIFLYSSSAHTYWFLEVFIIIIFPWGFLQRQWYHLKIGTLEVVIFLSNAFCFFFLRSAVARASSTALSVGGERGLHWRSPQGKEFPSLSHLVSLVEGELGLQRWRHIPDCVLWWVCPSCPGAPGKGGRASDSQGQSSVPARPLSC